MDVKHIRNTLKSEPSKEALAFYKYILPKKYHVALQYTHDGELYYLEFSPSIGTFASSDEASTFIAESKLPLGWVIITEEQLNDGLK